MMPRPPSVTDRQAGSALIVGLIMLLLMTMLAVASFHIGNVQTVVVSNALQQNQGVAAAQEAIEAVVNSSNYSTNPAAAITSESCGTGSGSNVLCVASNGGDKKDFKVVVATPFCIKAAPIPAAQLDLSAGPSSQDLGCLDSEQQGQFGVDGTVKGGSECATSTWEITAQATSTNNDTNVVTVTEGIGQRIRTVDMTNFCP